MILAAHSQVAERRRHRVYQKPELLAEAPNQVWSWVITKLMAVVKWSYFYLCAILDIFSCRVDGWRIEHAESAEASGANVGILNEKMPTNSKRQSAG